MSFLRDQNAISIQRFKADVFVFTKDSIMFNIEGRDHPYRARIDFNYKGSLELLEEAVRTNKKLWLILTLRNESSNSVSGRIFYLSDAYMINDLEEINPSKR